MTCMSQHFPFVSRAEFIRSKPPKFSAHVAGLRWSDDATVPSTSPTPPPPPPVSIVCHWLAHRAALIMASSRCDLSGFCVGMLPPPPTKHMVIELGERSRGEGRSRGEPRGGVTALFLSRRMHDAASKQSAPFIESKRDRKYAFF